jgi:hypothetical protein
MHNKMPCSISDGPQLPEDVPMWLPIEYDDDDWWRQQDEEMQRQEEEDGDTETK